MSGFRAGVTGAMTGALCVAMLVPQALVAEALTPPPVPSGKLSQQDRVLHALDRFTFGPRPGDVAAVEKMGLDAWFEEQLHPEEIDDTALETRLNAFPAMRLSEAELLQRFPSPTMIQQLVKTGAMPSDPVERAIYADAIANYEAQRKKQEAGGAATQAQAAMPARQSQISTAGQATRPKPTGDAETDSLMADLAMAADGPTAAPTPASSKGTPSQPDEDVQQVLAMPPDARFGTLVAMTPEQMMRFRAELRPFELQRLLAGMRPQQVEAVEAAQGPAKVVHFEVLQSRVERDVYSQRQLQAVMTDFWLNHFNVFIGKNPNEAYLLPAYLRETVLPHALGKFEDLLVATAQSPAMLMYLDNWESIGPDSLAAVRAKQAQAKRPNAQEPPKGINENYARELMELHTLGVNGGYTQQDVIEVAKCFTGWTMERPYEVGTGGAGGFVYEPNRHEPGAKTVLGQKIPEGGEQEGLTVLHMLATSPATAHFISRELAVRFVSDDPPAKLVDAMATTFLSSGGDMKAVLRTMFHAPEFWSAKVYRAKVKTPLEFVTSAVRASDAEVKSPLPLVQALNRLGMPVYGMQTPNGYSWQSSDWVSSNDLIGRMNFALVLSGNRLPNIRTDWLTLLGDAGDPRVAVDPTPATEKRLETLLLGQPAAANTRATVLAQFKNPTAQQLAAQGFNARAVNVNAPAASKPAAPPPARPETPLDTMAGLLLGSPEFQRR